jgi:dephospho-CoA kinase
MMKIIGITGGIASGKSTVVKLLKKRYHYVIIDADQLSREAVIKGSSGLEKIVDVFGQGILTNDGQLNRLKRKTEWDCSS